MMNMQPSSSLSTRAGLPSSSSAPDHDDRRYKGVRRRKWGRWVAEIRLPNSRERIWLGSHDTPEKAARAFDAAFVCLRGAGAADGLNFPTSPPAVPRTSDPNEVYAIAVSHASNHTNKAAAATGLLLEEDAGRIIDDPVLLAAHDDDDDVVPARIQVPSSERFDWSEFVHNPPPLYSPAVMRSHGHHLPMSLTAEFSMEETESSAFLSLWEF
ncbi:hypothetical protein QOZ80_6BG0464260 [Eleusine coracana subsp. coracana]|nr:hypothetical protein QOZ80_6BG0464260 [Eleusine coracana subsp. coracana]